MDLEERKPAGVTVAFARLVAGTELVAAGWNGLVLHCDVLALVLFVLRTSDLDLLSVRPELVVVGFGIRTRFDRNVFQVLLWVVWIIRENFSQPVTNLTTVFRR